MIGFAQPITQGVQLCIIEPLIGGHISAAQAVNYLVIFGTEKCVQNTPLIAACYDRKHAVEMFCGAHPAP